MANFLLTWNPKKSDVKDFDALMQDVRSGKKPFFWSIRSYRKIKKGDKVFLMKQHVEPRGIFLSGIVLYENNLQGSKQFKHFVDIKIDKYISPKEQILDRELLLKMDIGKKCDARFSGIRISDKSAKEIEKKLAKL